MTTTRNAFDGLAEHFAAYETFANSTQADRLYHYLRDVGPIRPLAAIISLGIYRVADPAHKLRKRGIPVKTRMVEVTNQFGETCHVAEYYLDNNEETKE